MKFNKLQKIGLHTLYWIFAAVFLSFFFWPTRSIPSLTLFLLSFILPQMMVVTYSINYLLIPRLLFRKRYWLFGYTLVGILIISVWITMLSLALMMIQAELQVIPTTRDFAVLLSGNYVIVFFAVIIHLIFSAFSDQLEKEQLAKRQVETELKLHLAQNELLKGQIHPHFLFNTLNNLYGLCLAQSDKTCETILKISELLDHMLYKCNQETVSISSEISFLNNFIALEEIRADERLQVVFETKIEDEETKIPPLLLFPFVENAFKHSAKGNTGKRNIRIELSSDEKELSLLVENNFIPSFEPHNESSGLGLPNVQKRLELLFPSQHTLSIESTDERFLVQLDLKLL